MLGIFNKITGVPYLRFLLKSDGKNLLRMGFCHHKCGTVYLNRVFNGVCKNTNLKYLKIEKNYDDIKFGNNFFFFPNGDYDDFIINVKNEYRAFHIVRDPRDVIVSGYFSHKYSHPTESEWGQTKLIEKRKFLNDATKEEGLMSEIKNGYALNKMQQWDFNNPNILEIKFEDLIVKPHEIFSRILSFLQIEFDSGVLQKILNNLTFEKMSKGRKPGEEDKMNHFRKGTPGDWRNHFADVHIKLFKEKWGNLLIKLGYEKDNNW